MQAWEEKYYEREEGAKDKLLEQIAKKLAKGKSPEEIADALEEDIQTIRQLMTELPE